MYINGNNYLLLEKRGCNFFAEDQNRGSDVGNYRVCTPYERIPGKNGRTYFLEFTLWRNRTKLRYTHKRTGKPLKNPVPEIINPVALHLNTSFQEGDYSYRDIKLEAQISAENPSFTVSDILRVTNDISTEHYDGIKWVESFQTTVPHGENFTPSMLIRRWAERNNLHTESRYGTLIVTLYTGTYKYLAYHIQPGPVQDLVTILLEEAAQ